MDKKRLTQMLSFISATLGIVSVACFFFPFLKIANETGSEGFYTGVEVCLGYTDNIVKMGMNFILIATLVLFVITAILTLVKYNNKIINLITIVLFLATTLLIFLLPIYAKSLGNMIIGSTYKVCLAWGSIVCGLISLISMFLNIATLIFNKKMENDPVNIDFSQYEQPAKEKPVAEEVVEENKEETTTDTTDTTTNTTSTDETNK